MAMTFMRKGRGNIRGIRCGKADWSDRGLYNTLTFLKMLEGELEGIPQKQYVYHWKF